MTKPVAVIALLDPDGAVVQRFDVAPPPSEGNQMPPLPTTLEWYRDLSKWLVTAAAGVLAIGLTTFGESTDNWLRLVFTAASGCLVGALASGALLHIYIVEFGKLWENRAGLKNDNEKGIKANQDARDKYLRRARNAYAWLQGAFCAGLLLYAIACAWRMWTSEAKRTYVAVSGGAPAETLLIDTGTGRVWEIVTDRQGKKRWQRSVDAVPR